MRPMAAALRWHLQSVHMMFQSYFHMITVVVDNFALSSLCTNHNGTLMKHFDDYFHMDDDDYCVDDVEVVAVLHSC